MEKPDVTQKFGKFEILEKLGQGGMGTVYKARDTGIGRIVALKTLNPDLLSDPKLLDRFAKEARAAGGLEHPNVVTIFEFDTGETSGQPFIAMQFIEGESLQKIIDRRAPMHLARKLQIISQFCKGLDYAHRHNLVHRDVKPANILVNNEGKVKVVDFGIVHMESTTMKTQTGVFMGTIQYASPEQVDGQHVDARSDIFSVGIVVYEFLAYRKPFDGNAIGAVINQILNKEPPPLSEVADGIPPELESIVNRCLHKRAEERFQSLDDLVIELEPIELGLQHALVEEMVGQGQVLMERGDLTHAQEVLRDAIVMDSANTTARELMSRVKAEIKKLESSSQVRQHLTEGEVHLKQGEYAEAIRSLEHVLKLDSHHGQARGLIEKARAEMQRQSEIRKALAAGRNAYKDGDLTGAEVQLQHVLEIDAKNPVAENLLGQIAQERGSRERRVRLRELTWEANNMVTQERYEEALSFIEASLQEFPDEQELVALADTARKGVDKRRFLNTEVEKIQTMIWKGDFKQAVDQAENMCIEFPQESQFTQLYEDAKTRQEGADRERRFGEELAAIQKLIESGEYDSATLRAGRLQKEFPDRPEAENLLSQAQTEKEQDLQHRLRALHHEVQQLVNDGKLQEAIRRAESARRELPGRAEIENLLANVRAALEEAQRKEEAREREEQKRKAEEARRQEEAREREAQKRKAEQARLEEEARRRDAQRELQEQLKKQKARPKEEKPRAAAPAPVPETSAMKGTAVHGAPPADLRSAAETVPQQAPPAAAPPGSAAAGGSPDATLPSVPAAGQEGAVGLPAPAPPPPEPKRAIAPVSVPAPKVEPPPPAPPKPRPAVEPARPRPPVTVAAKPAASKMPMIAGGAAVVLLVVGLAVWKFAGHGPTTPPGGVATTEQLKMQKDAQAFESQHQLEQALKDWNDLAQQASPLQDDAKAAATRVQGQIDEAKGDIKAAQDAANAKKYDEAEADYKKAEQIDAGQKTAADSGISGVEDLKSGLTQEQAEQKAFNRGQTLFRNRDYRSAQAAFQSVIDKKIPGSKLIPQAQDQLSKIGGLVEQQKKFDDAVAHYKTDPPGSKPMFQELVSQNTPWKGEAQTYLNKIKEQEDEATKAAAAKAKSDQDNANRTALAAAQNEFDGALNGGKYTDAEAAMSKVSSLGGSSTAELQKRIQDKYDGELRSLKSDAADNGTDANALKSVLGKVNELAGRAGGRGQSAKDYASKLQSQIDKLTAPTTVAANNTPTVTPTTHDNPPPRVTRQGNVSLMAVGHTDWKGTVDESKPYQQNFLDPGFSLESKPDLSSVDAPNGTTVIMQLEVSTEGQVTKVAKCLSGGASCQAVAGASGWKFSNPTVNQHHVRGIVGVTVKF